MGALVVAERPPFQPVGESPWPGWMATGYRALLLSSQQKTELPVTENVQTIPPPYVVRTILVYSRLPCQPQFSLTEPMKVSPQEREDSR